ncbi:MAG: isocitrate lyase/PEP mutase family protein [Rhodospirillaceae bacterium]|jgi:oxaloacetate decarboxylase|nr:isocitrate lyase/PEP mutase family protein [Rhodospirillaceae bacterium]MBT5940271.1 isocitrate lyase/PEP mutase family protein [Rhodospirillaceae bacterium]MBT7267151.1 isocitrate lyase/PEP mutase family protein [Rhodospirillaceae bacterium]
MNWTERRQRFRAQIESDQCVHPGSVFDPISARIAEDLGFEVGMFAGSIASMTVLGAPDLIVLTLSEFAEQAYRICRAGDLALLVDADHGYGNALNVKRTVEELETSGVAALTIEDTDLPQPHGIEGATRLLSIDEGVGKMKAALEGRQDKDLVVAARTSAFRATDNEDAIARALAYQAVGVDALFFAGVSTKEQVEMINENVSIPVFVAPQGKDIVDLPYLASHGVRICLQGHQPFSAAVQAVYSTLKALRDGVPTSEIENVASSDLMKQLTRDEDYQRQMKDYL